MLDAAGEPVAGASVARLTDAGQDFGNADLYARTTDANGRFEFHYSGLGPEPSASDRWILRARATTGEARLDVAAPWACGSAACPGYHADVVLTLAR